MRVEGMRSVGVLQLGAGHASGHEIGKPGSDAPGYIHGFHGLCLLEEFFLNLLAVAAVGSDFDQGLRSLARRGKLSTDAIGAELASPPQLAQGQLINVPKEDHE